MAAYLLYVLSTGHPSVNHASLLCPLHLYCHCAVGHWPRSPLSVYARLYGPVTVYEPRFLLMYMTVHWGFKWGCLCARVGSSWWSSAVAFPSDCITVVVAQIEESVVIVVHLPRVE